MANTITNGSYTIGSGGDYAQPLDAFDSVGTGTLTGDITFTILPSVTMTATGKIQCDLGGYRFRVTTANGHHGSVDSTKSIIQNINGDLFQLEATGSGVIEFDSLSLTTIANIAGAPYIFDIQPGSAHTILIHDILHDASPDGTPSIGFLRYYESDLAAPCSVWNVKSWGGYVGIRTGSVDGGGPVVVENMSVYDHSYGYYLFDEPNVTIRNSFGFDCLNGAFVDVDVNCVGEYCGSDDGTANDFSTATGCIVGLVDADEIQSFTDTDATFLVPTYDGAIFKAGNVPVCDNNGVGIAGNTRPWFSTLVSIGCHEYSPDTTYVDSTEYDFRFTEGNYTVHGYKYAARGGRGFALYGAQSSYCADTTDLIICLGGQTDVINDSSAEAITTDICGWLERTSEYTVLRTGDAFTSVILWAIPKFGHTYSGYAALNDTISLVDSIMTARADSLTTAFADSFAFTYLPGPDSVELKADGLHPNQYGYSQLVDAQWDNIKAGLTRYVDSTINVLSVGQSFMIPEDTRYGTIPMLDMHGDPYGFFPSYQTEFVSSSSQIKILNYKNDSVFVNLDSDSSTDSTTMQFWKPRYVNNEYYKITNDLVTSMVYKGRFDTRLPFRADFIYGSDTTSATVIFEYNYGRYWVRIPAGESLNSYYLLNRTIINNIIKNRLRRFYRIFRRRSDIKYKGKFNLESAQLRLFKNNIS